MSSPKLAELRDRLGRIYTPAVGPGLRPFLWLCLAGFALLFANGVYLAAIRLVERLAGADQTTPFYYLMFGLHLALGLLIIAPFIVFGLVHLVTSWKRPNRTAVRYGLMLLTASLALLISGLILVRIGGVFEIRDEKVRAIGYWIHLLTPLFAIILYIRHRLAGPRVKWEYARAWTAVVVAFVAFMAVFHTHDPRQGRKPNDPTYTFPSEVKLAGGKLIPEEALMMDKYCLKCHQDAYSGWFHSAHHFSSFNNKAYLTSIRETRVVSLERDGNTRPSRWCAGCHDPVPFLSGQMDDPHYNDLDTASSQAGITCVTCHAITHIGSSRGNADFTIEEPQHYPFAYDENPVLQWINNLLVKAKPEMHKKTFLKPLHKDAKFCSTCHKVSLPFALNHYQEFTRGQNHYDPFVLSGVSGGNAKSFYYPPVAKTNCAECHMELRVSSDFGAKDFDGTGVRKIHGHEFLGANTGLAALRGRPDIAALHEKYLSEQKVRIDLFGLREGGGIEGKLHAPLRPTTPVLEPGKSYLVETVVRTLNIGHPLSQGTVDSNEIWVELVAKSDGRVIGRSGGIGPDDQVDPYSHFINVYMLDKHGNRIDRRNPQDIFVPLYNKQIPPGAGQVVHFQLDIPRSHSAPIELEARVNYRKFDRTYFDYIFGKGKGPRLPIVLMARDHVRLAVNGGPSVENAPSPIKDEWQRWNDYGIGLLLEGGTKGGQKGELKQAEEVFKKVVELGKADGWVNLARVYQKEGRSQDAYDALKHASESKEPAAPWVISFLSAGLDERNGFLDSAIEKYTSVLNTRLPERKFDFGVDYEVRNLLGAAEYSRARLAPLQDPKRLERMKQAIATFRKTLEIDSENVAAHYGLGLAFADLLRFHSAGLSSAPVANQDTSGSPPTPKAVDLVAQSEALLEAFRAHPDPTSDSVVAQITALDHAVEAYLAAPREEFTNRVNPLLSLLDRTSPLYDAARNDAERAAMAQLLATTHKALHRMFKPDETAEGIAQRLAREKDPAANLNAQAIVIHSLHRPGAPGTDTPSTDTATRPQGDRKEAFE